MGKKEPKGNSSNLKRLLSFPIRFKHYKTPSFVSGKITAIGKENHVTLLPEDPSSLYGCFEDDPIVLILEDPKEIRTCQCYISQINYKSNSIELLVNNIENFVNRRIQSRYPVSIYANILGKYEMATSYISSISETGISLISNAQFALDEILEIEAQLGEQSLYFKLRVIWSKQLPTLSEYGLTNINCNPEIKDLIQLVLNDIILYIPSDQK